MRYVYLLLLLVAAIVAMGLAIANRELVTLSLDPTPFSYQLPLYVVLLGAVFLGIVIGACGMWLRDGKVRRKLRASRRDVELINEEMSALRSRYQSESAERQVATAG